MKTVDHYTMQNALKKRTSSPRKPKKSLGKKAGYFSATLMNGVKVYIRLPSWKHLIIIFAVALTLFVVFKGKSCLFGSEAIARVNGDKISANSFAYALRIEQDKRDPVMFKDPKQAAMLKKELLEIMIQDQLIYGEAKKAGTKLSDDEINNELLRFKSSYSENTFRTMLESRGISYDDWKEMKIRKLTIAKFLDQKIVDSVPATDKAIREYYNAHAGEFRRPDEVRVRQILVDSQEKAIAILDELKKGANFAVIATRDSMGPEAKKGGDLGFFARGNFPKIYDDVCFNLQPGKMSDIVKSDLGFHIFKMIEKKPARTLPLEQVKDLIVARIRQNESANFLEQWYEPLRKNAKVEINKELMSKTDLSKPLTGEGQ